MRQRLTLWLAALVGLIIALLIGGVVIALRYAGPETEARGPVMLYAFLGSVVFALVILFLWRDLNRGILQPLGALARDLDTLLQARQIDRSLRIPPGHHLEGLPEAIARLVDELRGSRREVVRAMATATARIEQEKGWLEIILLEMVREGVLVCSGEHRILLYNRSAARLFHYGHTLGLGRSLFDMLAEKPVRHALERLEFRLQSGQLELSTHFVCATRDARLMLQARIALILDQARKPSGYVLTLEDISTELAEMRRSEAIRRTVTRDLREPVASLRAAAENLHGYPDMEADQRQAFTEVIFKESIRLSQRIQALAEEYRGRTLGHWPMAEIHSPDLLNCIARHLQENAGIRVTVTGKSQWLKAESHSLLVVLEFLIERIANQTGFRDFTIEAGLGQTRAFIELRWQGSFIPGATLKEWMAAPLSALPEITVGEVLEHHSSEPWSRALEEGQALLRIPLQPPPEAEVTEEEFKAPPRPEFYDFDLMYAHSFTGDLGDRRLKDLSYVVFDTETTGLRPTQGDEIISIAAVRVTKGRVLSGETFDSLVNPGRSIPKDSVRFHGITDEKIKDQPPITEVLPRFHEFVGDAVLVAHNAAFDMKFLKLKEAECGVRFQNPVIDTLLLSLLVEGGNEDHSLDGICERLNITVENRHSALGDAIATAHVLVHLLDRLEAQGITTVEQVMKASNMEAELRFRAGHF